MTATGARRHGTLSGYHSGCRLACCRAAKAADHRRRSRLAAYGRPTTDLVDAAPVREHLLRLQAAGMSLETIARASGITASTVQRVVYGRRADGTGARVRAAAARTLLALRLDPSVMPDLGVIDSAGTRRRCEALQVLGYPMRDQARRTGYHRDSYRRAMAAERVTVALARSVRDLYEQLWATPAPDSIGARRARRAAAEAGYLPPLAWDEEWLDLPDGELAEVLAEQAAEMDEAEVRRCSTSYREGDRSPLIVAGRSEYLRRKRVQARKGASA